MEEVNKNKRFLDNLNMNSSSFFNTSMDIKIENNQVKTSLDPLPSSFANSDSNFNLLSSLNLSSGNILNDYSTKLNEKSSLSFYSPNSIATPLQLTPLISHPFYNSSLLLNNDSNTSNVTSTSFNLTTSILSPTFSSPGYDGSLPSPCTSPYSYHNYSNSFIPVCQPFSIHNNLNRDNLQSILSSTSSPKEPQNIHGFLDNLHTTFSNPDFYNQNQDTSFNTINPIQTEESFNLATATASPYRLTLNNSINPYLINQESSSLNSYNNNFKNPLITPNTNPRKSNSNINSNYFQINKNTVDQMIYTDNSPFLSPLANINNKHQLYKNSTFASVYNQILNTDNLKQTSNNNKNTQRENENIINQYFNLNSNPSLVSSNQDMSIPENSDFSLIKENNLSIPDIMNANPLPLTSSNNNTISSDEDPLKNPLKNVFQRNSSKNDDINQLLFSDPFLTSISNNDEINLINNTNSIINNNNFNIKNENLEDIKANHENKKENKNNNLNMKNTFDDETTFNSIVKDQSAFLENLNKELEDSLYNQFEKTNIVDNNDLLLSSSSFNSNSFLNTDGNRDANAKMFIINIYIKISIN